MSNNGLRLNYNESKILDTIARNLNIDVVATGSNIDKLATAYKEESNTFADYVNSSINNAFISSMDSDSLQTFGNSIGLPRNKYSAVKIFKEDSAIYLNVNASDILVTSLPQPQKVFLKDDIIYAGNSVTIKVVKDVVISNISDDIYISVVITSTEDSFYLSSGTTYKIRPTNEGKDIVPVLTLNITRGIGLSQLEEDEDSYRIRIMNSLYQSNNGANTALNTVLNEVPYIYTIETEDYSNRSIKTIYPYTEDLILSGTDDTLSRVLIPILRSSLDSKVMYGSNILIEEPKYLPFLIKITVNSNSTLLNNSYTDLVDYFNRAMYKEKSITKDQIINYIYNNSTIKSEDVKKLSIVFTSPYVASEQYELPNSVVNIPIGRFLHLIDLQVVSE